LGYKLDIPSFISKTYLKSYVESPDMLSYLGLNLSELYVLTAALNAQQASEREEKKRLQ
jgi:hypothetical protein